MIHEQISRGLTRYGLWHIVGMYKKMDPMDGFAVGSPINVTLAVFNKGACRWRGVCRGMRAVARARARLA